MHLDYTDTQDEYRVPSGRASKHAMTASVYCPRLSDEEIAASVKQLYDEMKSYRIRREKDMDASIEFAKHYTCR